MLASASWMNLVKRVFAEIIAKGILHDSHSSVDDLEAAICDYMQQTSAKTKSSVWSKIVDGVITRERGELETLNQIRENR
jgi:hypothetical protein